MLSRLGKRPIIGLRTSSLCRRVTLASLAVLVTIVIGFDLVLEAGLRWQLDTDLRSRLVDRATLAYQLDGRLPSQQLADRLSGNGVAASITSEGQVYEGHAPPPGTPASPAPAAGNSRPPQPRPPPGPPPSLVLRGRILTVSEVLSGGSVLTLRSSEESVATTLDRLRLLLTIGSLVWLAVAGILLRWVVGLALRPLDQLTMLASEIAGGRRGGRLRPDRRDTELGRAAAAFDSMLEALEAALLEAERAEQRMRDFLSDASHELRTPVAGIRASAEAVLRGPGSRAERERLLVAILREAQRASRLVEDLLSAARFDHGGQLELVPVDVAELVQQAAERCRLLNPQLELLLHGEIDCNLEADPMKVAQVLANLLDNACRVTPTGGRVEIRVRASHDLVMVEVHDQGPGVPRADRERIFERFVRLDAARASFGAGAGLGLAIARQLARAHGGDIECLFRRRGACFRLSLPRARTPQGAVSA